jgi:hypothetical protein
MTRLLLLTGLVVRVTAYGGAIFGAQTLNGSLSAAAAVVAALAVLELTLLRATDRWTGLDAARERGFVRSLRR